MDRRGAQVVSVGVAEGRKRRLERDLSQFRQDSNSNTGC